MDQNQFSPVSRVYVPSDSMYTSKVFVKSFYTDLHDKWTDSLVPAMGRVGSHVSLKAVIFTE